MKVLQFLFLFLFLIPIICIAQTTDSQCEALVFSLDEAVASSCPDEVTGIDLTLQGHAEFPRQLLKFKQLNDVNLSGNALKSIPEDIQMLKRLRYLDLSNNKLKKLPESLWKIKGLRSVSVANNKFSKKERQRLVAQHADILNPVDENGDVIWKSKDLIFVE